MAYVVKELFLTLQGEGVHAGRPAVFLRFSGCNLWSGRSDERARGRGSCALWCDTDFLGTDGPGGGRFTTPEALADAVQAYWPATSTARPWVVCTGGEPLLQLDGALVAAMHARGFAVAVETNGTVAPPCGIDWLCVSPKAETEVIVRAGDELKLVYPQAGLAPEAFLSWDFLHFSLQPLDGPDHAASTRAALEYCLAHPPWRLSLQIHKILGIP